MSSPNGRQSRSAENRAKLKHPIIDSDGHVAEFEPEFFDYLKEEGGAEAVERLKALPDSPFCFRWYRLSEEERRALRVPRPHWWVYPAMNTLDRATSFLPGCSISGWTKWDSISRAQSACDGAIRSGAAR
ncbi:MAG: hypothetical protein ABSG46_05540 [Candidatus Binataceae bacterium]|jgi:hypothetical protein